MASFSSARFSPEVVGYGPIKRYRGDIATRSVSAAGSITLATTIATGNGFEDKTTNVIKISQINIRWYLSADTATQINHCRFGLLWDRVPDGVLPTTGDLFGNFAVDKSMSHWNPDTIDRFVHLWDDERVNAGVIGAATTNALCGFSGYLELKDLDIYTIYTAADTTGVIANIIDGNLLWYNIGSAATGTGDSTLVTICEVFFQDAYLEGRRT